MVWPIVVNFADFVIFVNFINGVTNFLKFRSFRNCFQSWTSLNVCNSFKMKEKNYANWTTLKQHSKLKTWTMTNQDYRTLIYVISGTFALKIARLNFDLLFTFDCAKLAMLPRVFNKATRFKWKKGKTSLFILKCFTALDNWFVPTSTKTG